MPEGCAVITGGKNIQGRPVVLIPGQGVVHGFLANDPNHPMLRDRSSAAGSRDAAAQQREAERWAEQQRQRKEQQEAEAQAACEAAAAYQRQIEETASRAPLNLDTEIAVAVEHLAGKRAALDVAAEAHRTAASVHAERVKDVSVAQAELMRAKTADDRERTRLATLPVAERPRMPQTFERIQAAEIAIDIAKRAVPPAAACVAEAKAALERAEKDVAIAAEDIRRLHGRVARDGVERIKAQLKLAEQRYRPYEYLFLDPEAFKAVGLTLSLSTPLSQLPKTVDPWAAEAAAAHAVRRPA